MIVVAGGHISFHKHQCQTQPLWQDGVKLILNINYESDVDIQIHAVMASLGVKAITLCLGWKNLEKWRLLKLKQQASNRYGRPRFLKKPFQPKTSPVFVDFFWDSGRFFFKLKGTSGPHIYQLTMDFNKWNPKPPPGFFKAGPGEPSGGELWRCCFGCRFKSHWLGARHVVVQKVWHHVCHGQKSRFFGDGRPPTFNRHPYNGYINPYYWVDDHPLLYGNNESLDPGTCRVIHKRL